MIGWYKNHKISVKNYVTMQIKKKKIHVAAIRIWAYSAQPKYIEPPSETWGVMQYNALSGCKPDTRPSLHNLQPKFVYLFHLHQKYKMLTKPFPVWRQIFDFLPASQRDWQLNYLLLTQLTMYVMDNASLIKSSLVKLLKKLISLSSIK